MSKSYHVYIAECRYGTYYTGYTGDIEKRLKKHNEGSGAKYLRGRAPVRIIWVKEYQSKRGALRAESAIKRLTRKQKKELVDCYEGKVYV